MDRKLRVGILFGGKSAEHDVSIQSARNIAEAIDREKYDVVLIALDRNGRWLLEDDSRRLLEGSTRLEISDTGQTPSLAVVPGQEQPIQVSSADHYAPPLDVVFPVLHGPFGEDGTVQGLLRLANLPFVGAGVLGSAVGMDKDVMKRLLRDAGVPIAKFLVLHRNSPTPKFDVVAQQLGTPLFVKPANLGSSVGIHKVSSPEEFVAAVADAFRYDNKVLIEECIVGREIECSVLGNEKPIASIPGEVLPTHDFYDFEAKYQDENGAVLEIPAQLPVDVVSRIQQMAIEAFQTLCCEGMARVDFFLQNDGRLLVNEINTIPGFTNISMYPKLWEASGLDYRELIDQLLLLAIERFNRDEQLRSTV